MKTLFDIESYRTRFLGGARSYLFFVLFAFPGAVSETGDSKLINTLKSALSTFGLGAEQDKIPYLVKSTQLPSYGINEVVTPYPRFDLKTAGYPTYSDWSVIMNVDKKGEILNKFRMWLDMEKVEVPRSYMFDQFIYLVDYQGSSFMEYKLIGAWPKSMSAVTLDYSSVDIATLEITFSYQYFETKMESPEKSSLIKKAAGRIAGLMP